MKKSLLIGSVFLLTAAAIGVAVASSEIRLLGHHDDEGRPAMTGWAGSPTQMADRGERDRHSGRHHGRRHHDDDDDDDERGEGQSRGTLSRNGQADPNAPVPDNGLFNNKARPTVEVR